MKLSVSDCSKTFTSNFDNINLAGLKYCDFWGKNLCMPARQKNEEVKVPKERDTVANS